MGIAIDIAEDWHASLAALAWQVEAGVDEVIGDGPVNRYELAAEAKAAPAPKAAPPQISGDPVTAARDLAASAQSVNDLREALSGFDHCELKRGARNLVFADGNSEARVMVLGEPPDREEDLEGRPFAGRTGTLLDRMFAAIGLSRSAPDPGQAIYLANVMPWRPPGDRDLEPVEIAMLRPFVERHISLADPDVIVVMGSTPLLTLIGQKSILRARGIWSTALGKPLLPMLHPAALLKNPADKRDAWADLLALKARLGG